MPDFGRGYLERLAARKGVSPNVADGFLSNVKTTPARQLLGGDGFPLGPSRDDVMARGQLSLFHLGALDSLTYGFRAIRTIGAAYNSVAVEVPQNDTIRVSAASCGLYDVGNALVVTSFVAIACIPGIQRPLTMVAGTASTIANTKDGAGFLAASGSELGENASSMAIYRGDLVLNPGDRLYGAAEGVNAGDYLSLVIYYQRQPGNCRPPV